MINVLQQLNKAFESRIRLGIMSMLIVNDFVTYSDLKNELNVTDGNLASHLNALEEAGYIKVTKSFIGKKPNTKYAATSKGRRAFQEHLDGLTQLIKGK